MKNEVTGTPSVANKGVTLAVTRVKKHLASFAWSTLIFSFASLVVFEETREAKEREPGIEVVALA